MSSPWHIFTGVSEPHSAAFPAAPPWRRFSEHGSPAASSEVPAASAGAIHTARTYRTAPAILDAINAALILRRPLLVTGPPGSGKSSLIQRVAYELQLGQVLVWPVNSRSTLKEGLYDYDAIGRLHDHSLEAGQRRNVSHYLRLRALGTALLPAARPRAILIDELDKADPDLPNDLLNIFEEGWYEIPELQRHGEANVSVRTADVALVTDTTSRKAEIQNGRVQCTEFPFVVLTSNGEREFPAAFLRRCIRIDLLAPDAQQMMDIVQSHLGAELMAKAKDQIADFLASDKGPAATDQLLNSLYIVHEVGGLSDAQMASVHATLTRPLD